MIEYELDVRAEVAYARRWAFGRDPAFASFDDLGGDCTNFISQCIYAGGALMNFTPDVGWYYRSLNDRAAAWTSVYYFHKFITTNTGVGPYGWEIPIDQVRPGDVIQLGDSFGFYHSLLTVAVRAGEPYVAAHSDNAFDRPLSSYRPKYIRIMRIKGRRYVGGYGRRRML